ncbi:hypothetical protein FOZ61_006981 [Perkinsus olseni]|uniref:Uncharacterized protein n=1 Tax=Perkinsus olseni TaxID=32597 RepID=A0A7J6M9I4_PEROL|nr:hypothetical protein FOZ61_006981 [Perkinsus olseni]
MPSQRGGCHGSKNRGSFLHDIFEEDIGSLLKWHIYRSPNEQRRFVHFVKDLYRNYKDEVIGSRIAASQIPDRQERRVFLGPSKSVPLILPPIKVPPSKDSEDSFAAVAQPIDVYLNRRGAALRRRRNKRGPATSDGGQSETMSEFLLGSVSSQPSSSAGICRSRSGDSCTPHPAKQRISTRRILNYFASVATNSTSVGSRSSGSVWTSVSCMTKTSRGGSDYSALMTKYHDDYRFHRRAMRVNFRRWTSAQAHEATGPLPTQSYPNERRLITWYDRDFNGVLPDGSKKQKPDESSSSRIASNAFSPGVDRGLLRGVFKPHLFGFIQNHVQRLTPVDRECFMSCLRSLHTLRKESQYVTMHKREFPPLAEHTRMWRPATARPVMDRIKLCQSKVTLSGDPALKAFEGPCRATLAEAMREAAASRLINGDAASNEKNPKLVLQRLLERARRDDEESPSIGIFSMSEITPTDATHVSLADSVDPRCDDATV